MNNSCQWRADSQRPGLLLWKKCSGFFRITQRELWVPRVLALSRAECPENVGWKPNHRGLSALVHLDQPGSPWAVVWLGTTQDHPLWSCWGPTGRV